MIDWATCSAVESSREVVSGAWVFRGTRVPIAAMFENLESGATLADFIQWFPGVSVEQAKAVLEHAAQGSLSPAWMRILFDQGTPAPLRALLVGHDVTTAYERGWSRLQNAELLAVADEQYFEALITTDRNLRYQQNLSGRAIAIVVLSTTSWPRIQLAANLIVAALASLPSGGYAEVEIPWRSTKADAGEGLGSGALVTNRKDALSSARRLMY
jgi:uncharacterized protein (DUF433 family)